MAVSKPAGINNTGVIKLSVLPLDNAGVLILFSQSELFPPLGKLFALFITDHLIISNGLGVCKVSQPVDG